MAGRGQTEVEKSMSVKAVLAGVLLSDIAMEIIVISGPQARQSLSELRCLFKIRFSKA